MCDLRIGRGLSLVDVAVRALGMRQDETAITGRLRGTPVEVNHAVQQLRDMVGHPDEAFVPVVVTPCTLGHLPIQSGYYRVLGVEVSMVPLKYDQAEVDVNLGRVQGFAAPLFESVILGGKRANLLASTTATPQAWQALPATVQGYENGQITPTVETVTTADGNLSVFTDTLNRLFDARVEFYLPPQDWYVGAATLLIDDRVQVGAQVPNRPTGWAIHNSIIELGGVPGQGRIRMRRWNGTAWVLVGYWEFGQYGGGAQPKLSNPPLAVTVLRNDPACVTIRLAYDAASVVTNARFAVNVDLSLRRGSRMAEVYLSTRGAYRWLITTPIPYAQSVFGTAGSGAAAASAAAGAAAGAAIAYGNAEGLDPADPRSYALTATNPDPTFLHCGIGHIAGSITAATVATFGRRYLASQSERVLAVAR